MTTPGSVEVMSRVAKAAEVVEQVAREAAKIAMTEAEIDAKEQEATTAGALERDHVEKIRQYRERGLDPVYADEEHTIVVSLPMMLHMGWQIGEIDGRKALVR